MTTQLIDAAKALLADIASNPAVPQFSFVATGRVLDLRAAVEAAEKQPVQEPVGSLTVRRPRGNDSMVNIDLDYLSGLPNGTYSVYAAPVAQQEAKPLSDEQIVEIMRDGNNCNYNDEAEHVSFARAIEAAHGIKSPELGVKP